MKEELLLKTGLSGLTAIITYYTSNFTSLIWLLILFEISDYVTGILVSIKTKNLSSYTAFWGFIKKIGYFFLVGVAFGVDYLIIGTVALTGIELNYPTIFGVLSVCYLLSTEAISILENLSEFGINVPFLSKFLKKFREKISDKSNNE